VLVHGVRMLLSCTLKQGVKRSTRLGGNESLVFIDVTVYRF
jgi:hypothetical protein